MPVREAPTIVEPPSTALGAIALAGDSCPHTGWWQCTEVNARVRVYNGQRQFIAEGRRMPQALLLPQPTVWQRVRGLQPSYESRSPTRLRLADKRHRPRAPVQAMPAPAVTGLAIPGHASGFELDNAPDLASVPAPDLGHMPHDDALIGSVAQTSAACPASGWWRCDDSEALDGTRWFAAGSQLPRASFAQRVRRHSSWTLVRLASEP
jgi:hypothetical protein